MYTEGNCTAFCFEERPDLPDNLGDAQTWAANAAAAGFPVSHVPAIGDIAQWPPNYAGADEFGHVASVLAVNAAGDITVREENWQGLGVIDTRVVLSNIAAGLWYIGGQPGEPMIKSDRLEVARMGVDLAYWAIGHRAPESPVPGVPSVRDNWAMLGVSGGMPQMLEALANSDEFTADERADFQRDHPPAA